MGAICSFFTQLKKFWSEAVEFFLTFTKATALPFGLKPGFFKTAWVLRPTAWMTTFSRHKLNQCFKPLLVFKFGWFLALERPNFLQPVKRNVHIFNYAAGYKNFANIFCKFEMPWSGGFSIMYILLFLDIYIVANIYNMYLDLKKIIIIANLHFFFPRMYHLSYFDIKHGN